MQQIRRFNLGPECQECICPDCAKRESCEGAYLLAPQSLHCEEHCRGIECNVTYCRDFQPAEGNTAEPAAPGEQCSGTCGSGQCLDPRCRQFGCPWPEK